MGVNGFQVRGPRFSVLQYGVGVDVDRRAALKFRLVIERALDGFVHRAALLAFATVGIEKLDVGSVFYFAGIDGARFKRPVEPGDQLMLHVTLDRIKSGIVKFTTDARVGDAVVAEAELMCTMRTV